MTRKINIFYYTNVRLGEREEKKVRESVTVNSRNTDVVDECTFQERMKSVVSMSYDDDSKKNDKDLSTVEMATNGESQASTLDDPERPWTTMNVTYQVG